MKILMLILLSLVSLAALAVEYPVKNIRYLSTDDYLREVQNSDQYIVMVFSSQECLERIVPERNCWLFERRLDAFTPSFSSKFKVIGFNTYYENYSLVAFFNLVFFPTVIIMKDNYILERLEPQTHFGWQDELLKRTLEAVYQIR